jgi:hypothetical protein
MKINKIMCTFSVYGWWDGWGDQCGNCKKFDYDVEYRSSVGKMLCSDCYLTAGS